ncbi:unnamed protein product [Arabidopsis arenosa]|uniref:Sacsin/Nov domain-containing protein n=1 Tax=Arabidopsis arenosa TaxID=38785 RepID=A0A8S2A811_ARAAE|nr:unnamed protein product [Arabidopsis arenosa]
MAESAKQHIDRIRKTKFSIGGAYNPLTEDLHQALYSTPRMFTSSWNLSNTQKWVRRLRLNAEDNEYLEGVDPSLEFILTYEDITATGATATLLIFNNETGFSEKNIESICSVVRSTKNGIRKRGFIGEKGIGFKSVFLITSQPYIFSNGYQICFNEAPCSRNSNLGYIVPEWVEQHPSLVDIQRIYGFGSALPTTTIILPLKSDKVKPVKEQLSNVHPEQRLWSRKSIDAESYMIHLSACGKTFSYYMWRQKFPVKDENRVGRRSEVEEFFITMAFPFGDRLALGNSSPPGIYALLPTEMVTNFPFIYHTRRFYHGIV